MRAELTLDVRSVAAPDTVADRILDACQLARIVHVRAHPVLGLRRDFWQDIVTRHGMQVAVDENALTGEPTGALWSDVEFDPQMTGVFRHSSSAQPLHTDGSYIGNPPQIVFLICHRAAAAGGATLFVDGIDLIEMLGREQPGLLSELTRTPLRFAKGGCVVEAPCIVRVAGQLSLRWNYFALDRDLLSNGQRRMVERLQSILLQLVSDRRTRAVLMHAGDAVFFADSQVLHGRDAFRASQRGDRCLWKGGLAFQPASAMRAAQ